MMFYRFMFDRCKFLQILSSICLFQFCNVDNLIKERNFDFKMILNASYNTRVHNSVKVLKIGAPKKKFNAKIQQFLYRIYFFFAFWPKVAYKCDVCKMQTGTISSCLFFIQMSTILDNVLLFFSSPNILSNDNCHSSNVFFEMWTKLGDMEIAA